MIAPPIKEVRLAHHGVSYMALVYDPIEDGCRDVVVHQVREGWHRYVGLGVVGTRFVRVESLSSGLARAVARAVEMQGD